jgi:hypothetical protein
MSGTSGTTVTEYSVITIVLKNLYISEDTTNFVCGTIGDPYVLV